MNKYSNALKILGWSHVEAAEYLGIGRRSSSGYANPQTQDRPPPPRPVRLLLQLLVIAKLHDEALFRRFMREL